MKRTLATSIGAIVLVGLGFGAVADVARHPAPPPWRVAMDVDLKPIPGTPGQFLLTSTVTDLERHALIAQPRMTIVAGRPARFALGGNGWRLQLGIEADGGSRKAEYDATFSRGATVLSRQRLTLDLNG